MRIDEAARELHRSQNTIRNWIDAKILGAKKIGRFWDIPESEVERVKRDGLELKRQDE